MALYLVQHGKSLPKEEDPEQGLSDEGISDVDRIAEVAKGYGVAVSEIWHSEKRRAGQTADRLAAALTPVRKPLEKSGLKPLDDVIALADTFKPDVDLMVVGHLPFMERLTNYLVTGSVENLVFRFQNGGILCLDRDSESRTWFIKWSLMPNIGGP